MRRTRIVSTSGVARVVLRAGCALLLIVASYHAVCQTPNTAPRAHNPTSLKKLSLEELGTLSVTTYRKAPTEVGDTPAAIYVITSSDILRSGVTTIADALRLAPGVEVGRLSATTWAVGIRGLENNFSKSVLVLIDGRNVYTPLFAGVYWDVQDMPLDDIDHIEVIRGPGGTIWGPNAANGVINIITKNAADTKGILADALGGTQDHTIDDLQYGGTASGADYRFFGRGFVRRHEYHPDGINDDSWHQARFGFRVDRAVDRDVYCLEGAIYKGTSPHIVGATPSYDETSGGDLNVRWQRNLSKASGFYLQAYFDRTLRTHAAVGETRNTFDIDFMHHFHVGQRHLFSYGGGLRWSPYLTIPAGVLVPASDTDHIYTGFVQDQIRLQSDLFFTIGTKLENNNFSGFDAQPSARLLWSPGDRQSLWLGVTRAVTTPSDIEENFRLQAVGPATVIQVLGNHNFLSENVVGYEAGYRRGVGKAVYVDLASFWNKYTRLQSFSAPALSFSGGKTYITIQYENQISGSTTGFELTFQTQIQPWWHANSSYSYLNSNFTAHGPTSDISSTGSVRTYEKSSPKHMVSLQSKIDLPLGIQFDQDYRYVSALAAQKVRAYHTMDAHLQKTLGKGLLLELAAQNLFQPRHNEWGTGDPTQSPVGVYRAAYARLAFGSKHWPWQ